MASNVTTCTVVACPRPAYKRQLCRAHHQRLMRHGDPLGGRIGPHETRAFLARAAEHQGDDCLLWPYAKGTAGYGQTNINGTPMSAHRAVLILATGEPPYPDMQAAHAPLVCHNRLCVNPRHLRWATRIENMADKVLDGTDPARIRRQRTNQ